MNQQQPQRPKRKIKLSDIFLLLVAVFLIYMTPWGETNSFHRLLIFLFFLCFLLRFSNARKQKMREFAMKKKMEEQAALNASPEQIPAEAAPMEDAPADTVTEADADTTEKTNANL
ncbi:hypothetical protein [Anaerotignum sp.]|uniref:hypothetical protein n=1 Tax=Anaerotignum sp. TaxID=2039241 RepID=UPI003736BBA0